MSASPTIFTAVKGQASVVDKIVGNKSDLSELDKIVLAVVNKAPAILPTTNELYKLAIMLARGVAMMNWAKANEAKIDTLVRILLYGIAMDKKWEHVGTACDPLNKEPNLYIISNAYSLLKAYAAACNGVAMPLGEPAAVAGSTPTGLDKARKHRLRRGDSKTATNAPSAPPMDDPVPSEQSGLYPALSGSDMDNSLDQKTLDEAIPISPIAPISSIDSIHLPPPTGVVRTIAK